MEIAQTIDDTLKQYYSKKGKPVPNWRVNKNPQWWVDYLKELGIDQWPHRVLKQRVETYRNGLENVS